MKKEKLKERLENLNKSFFDSESLFAESQLEYADAEDIDFSQQDSLDSKWFGGYKTFLKQALLYFPGTFMLLHYSAGFTYNNLSGIDAPVYYPLVFMSIIASLMCILGLGDIRNPKHVSIPLSVASVGILMGLINVIVGDILISLNDGSSLMFLPFALMSGFLAKYLVDK